MNRGTVVFLALAILLAHTLAIHQTPDGEFAPPYELAHVAYRLGRNLVYEGRALWNTGGEEVESYPSPLWIGLAAVAARLYSSPTILAQGFDLFCALATIVVLAQFSPKRTAGLIAPVLLASSGSAAAAAASGMETALAMSLVTGAFLAFERRAPRALALVLCALLWTRPEGLAVCAALLALECWARPRTENARRPSCLRAFLPPLALVLATCALRRMITGVWLSPFAAPLVAWDVERFSLGAHYLWSFVYASGFGLLVVVLALSLVAGRMSAMGTRALSLAAVWAAVVGLSGGDGLPFWSALAPALPLFFLSVQEGLSEWMDRTPALAPGVWSLLLVSVTAAFLVSKTPGDIGPFRLEQPLTRWQQPTARLAHAFDRPLGRLGLLEEIRMVEHLRPLGIFLRDRVSADAAILTFWPGAIGYLSRREVHDLLGRTTPLPGETRPRSWRGVPPVEPLAALRRPADYLVPAVGTLPESSAPADILRHWLEFYEAVGAAGGSSERLRELIIALRGYELVCVPVPAKSQDPREPSERAFPLLRNKELELAPRLVLEQEGRTLRVLVHHKGPQQVVDLHVQCADRAGATRSLRPTGDWVSAPVDARTSVLLFATGPRPIQLLEAQLPVDLAGGRLTARLHNPGMVPDAVFSAVGAPAVVELR